MNTRLTFLIILFLGFSVAGFMFFSSHGATPEYSGAQLLQPQETVSAPIHLSNDDVIPDAERANYPIKVKVSTDTPGWGDGEIVVPGNAVTIKEDPRR